MSYHSILDLIGCLDRGNRISVTDKDGKPICFADYLGEACNYIIDNCLYDEAKELIKYEDLFYNTHVYCSTDEASEEAKQMNAECDFAGCVAVIDNLKFWLNRKQKNPIEKQNKVYLSDNINTGNKDLTGDEINRLAASVERLEMLWDGALYDMGDGYFCNNPNIHDRKEACVSLKKLYDEYYPYMTAENLSMDYLDYSHSLMSYGLSKLKGLWETQAKYYYDELQKQESQGLKIEVTGIEEEYFKKEEVYFKKAVEAGYMQETKTGYRWTFGGNRGKARLSYFISKIYGKYEQIPYSRLERLFGVSRLDSGVYQVMDAKRPQKWRPEIDKLFED